MPPEKLSPSRNQSAAARLLVVEDNAVNREVIREMLRDAGFAVDVAGNGFEAFHARSPGTMT